MKTYRMLQIVALFSAEIIFTSCNGKAKDMTDRIIGRKDSPPSLFKLSRESLPGIYLIEQFGDANRIRSLVGFPSESLTSIQQVWRFTDTSLDVYAVNPSARCGERAYSVEGDATLRLLAPSSCAEERLEILSQNGSREFSVRQAPFTFQNESFDRIGFASRTPAQARQSLYDWDFDFAQAPQWLNDYLPIEASTSAIDNARAGFKAAHFDGVQMELKGEFSGEVTDFFTTQVLVVKNGKAISVTKSTEEPGDTTCIFSAKSSSGETLKNGFKHKVKSIKVYHSRREKGIWTLENGQESESINHYRDNMIDFEFEDFPKDLSVRCTRDKGPTVLSVDDVKSAFGTIVSLTP